MNAQGTFLKKQSHIDGIWAWVTVSVCVYVRVCVHVCVCCVWCVRVCVCGLCYNGTSYHQGLTQFVLFYSSLDISEQ